MIIIDMYINRWY